MGLEALCGRGAAEAAGRRAAVLAAGAEGEAAGDRDAGGCSRFAFGLGGSWPAGGSRRSRSGVASRRSGRSTTTICSSGSRRRNKWGPGGCECRGCQAGATGRPGGAAARRPPWAVPYAQDQQQQQ